MQAQGQRCTDFNNAPFWERLRVCACPIRLNGYAPSPRQQGECREHLLLDVLCTATIHTADPYSPPSPHLFPSPLPRPRRAMLPALPTRRTLTTSSSLPRPSMSRCLRRHAPTWTRQLCGSWRTARRASSTPWRPCLVVSWARRSSRQCLARWVWEGHTGHGRAGVGGCLVAVCEGEGQRLCGSAQYFCVRSPLCLPHTLAERLLPTRVWCTTSASQHPSSFPCPLPTRPQFSPIFQWLYFDSIESLPSGELPAEEYAPTGGR